MQRHTGRFSIYIRPFSYLLDLMIINFLANSLLIDIFNGIYYHFFISFSWIVISWNVRFYEVYRFTKSSEILEKIGKQYATFIVVNFAYIGYFLKFSDPSLIIKFVSIATGLIAFEKLFIYYFLRKFRVVYGGNFRRVVIVGEEKHTAHLVEFFNENPNYGYKHVKLFDLQSNKKEKIQECFQFVVENKIGLLRIGRFIYYRCK